MTDLPEDLRRLEEALQACRNDPVIQEILRLEGIGPYALVGFLCESQAGVAYLVEQIEPVPRRVALFIYRTAPDPRIVRPVFQTGETGPEPRGPPQLVRVLETGFLEDGRAYRVMRFEAGLPASAYCL